MKKSDKHTLSQRQTMICAHYEDALRDLPDGEWRYRDVGLDKSRLHKFAAHDLVEKTKNASSNAPVTHWRLAPKTQAWLDDRRTADNDNED